MATAKNPFDLSTNTGSDLLTAATGALAAPETTGYNAATADASGYDATQSNAFGYNPTQWDVDASQQTVQGQMAGILAANSPLLRQAQATSLAQMNRRGLANSSMAVGAGQQAVINTAMPIAQQDATLYANQAKYTADIGNQASQFTAAAQNQAALANAAAANQASQFTAGAANQAALANASAQNQAAQFTAGSANQAASEYAQALNATVNTMLDQSMKYALANADTETKIELQRIDAETRAYLAKTEATYKNQMQASASANEIFQQVSKNIADIMANPDLETGPKDAAVKAQQQYLQNALGILSATSGVPNLKNLLTFP